MNVKSLEEGLIKIEGNSNKALNNLAERLSVFDHYYNYSNNKRMQSMKLNLHYSKKDYQL